MSLGNRIRIACGVIAVVALIFALFMYLNYSMSNITSRTAELESDQYVVSVDNGGTVTRQYVQVGDTVKKDDPLFEIKSPSLQAQIKDKRTSEQNLLYSLTPEGNILLKAANSGVVRNVQFVQGSYAPDNAQLATLTVSGTDYVLAKYSLNAPDYARIERDAPLRVTLPDNKTLEARVFDVTLERQDDTVLTVVKARFDKNATIPKTFTAGTPVTAEWELKNETWFDALTDWVRSVVRPQTMIGG